MLVRTALRWAELWARGAVVDDRRARLGWMLVQVVALAVVIPPIAKMLAPVTTQPRPPRLVDGPADARFGLDLATRKEIFSELAATEPRSREAGIAGFPGLPWSQEDHRAAFERDAVRSIASRRSLNLTQVYLVLDEGIRSRWPGADGKPLMATSIPLDPRRK